MARYMDIDAMVYSEDEAAEWALQAEMDDKWNSATATDAMENIVYDSTDSVSELVSSPPVSTGDPKSVVPTPSLLPEPVVTGPTVGKPHQLEPEPSAEWPRPLPFERTLPPVEPFYAELLPNCLRARSLDIGERLQVSPDLPAAALVLTLAGATGRRAMIQPYAFDYEWVIRPNLYGCIIAPPGAKKTAVMSKAIKPLDTLERELGKLHELQQKNYNELED